MTEILISVQQTPSRWSQILSSPIILLVMRSEALFLNEVKKNMMKFNIKCRLPEWISFFYANLHVFDHLLLPHVTQTSQSDFRYFDSIWTTFIPLEWKKTPKKGSYHWIAHTCRHFSCCFAVKSIHPGIKLSPWKWDDNSVCHDLVCVSVNRDIMTGKTAGKLWKFRVFTQNTSVGLNI